MKLLTCAVLASAVPCILTAPTSRGCGVNHDLKSAKPTVTLCVDHSAPVAVPTCSGCTPIKFQDLRDLTIYCDCPNDTGSIFGALVITNEGTSFDPCSGLFSCSSDGCEWHYDLKLVVDDDRPADCFPNGVYFEQNGGSRTNILNYDWGTLQSAAGPCNENGPVTGNQVNITIFSSASGSSMCGWIVMTVKCTVCQG